MGGGLMQLVAYGAQDVYLTGNPVITFFKVVYRRHTNFAMESIQQTFNGTPGFGSRVSATISRNGDLITNTYLQVTLKNVGLAKTDSIGHALIKTVELEIGGQRIDKHYGDWLEIWSELTVPEEKRVGFNTMVGKNQIQPDASGGYTGVTLADSVLFIPLQFFFCRNPGLALPLIALQYHEVKINVEFNAYDDVFNTSSTATMDCSLYVDYVYLDTCLLYTSDAADE